MYLTEYVKHYKHVVDVLFTYSSEENKTFGDLVTNSLKLFNSS